MSLFVDEIIRRNALVYRDRVAATMDGETLTYGAIEDLSLHEAQALRRAGVGLRDRVLCWSDNTLDLVPLILALAKIGAVFAPINARLNVSEAIDLVRFARPHLLVADDPHWERAQEIARDLGIPCRRLGTTDHRDDVADAIVEANRDERDTQVLFFTSGSTGRPKGVLLSHRTNFLRSFQGEYVDAPQRIICMFPLFHMGALTLALIAWQTAGEVTFVRAPTAAALLDAVVARKATHLYCIPAVWSRILAEDTGRWDLTSLRCIDTGTSATPPELIRALKDRFPASLVRVFYGSTEAGFVAALFDSDVLARPGSVGRPGVGVELRLSDAGEICVRNHYLMDGYYENPEATRAALIDGWYHSGDRGALDDEGFLFVTGRLKDIIRSGGETVSPAEIETILAPHPAIADVAVVGIPDATWGEIVCAAIIPKDPTAPPTLEDLKEFLAGRVASYKLPRRLAITDTIPRTAATGQIQRTLIIERLQSKLD